MSIINNNQTKLFPDSLTNQNKSSDIFSADNIRALSWKQPYGSLMLPPNFKIETRTWKTSYRGWVLICASLKMYDTKVIKQISGEYQTNRIFGHPAYLSNINMWVGHAIGVGKLIDCRPMEYEDEDKCFVEYYSDLYCHIYADVKKITPFPYKGKQGWGKVTEEYFKQIKFL